MAGVIATEWGIGGYNSPFFIHAALFQRALLQLPALKDPLRTLFRPRFSDTDWENWRREIARAEETLRKNLPKPRSTDGGNEEGVRRAIEKLDRKSAKTNEKLMHELRKMFGDDFDLPDD